MHRLRVLFGISVFWMALAILFDGVNTLVLPRHLLAFVDPAHRATALGLLTFVGIVAGMLLQPVVGTFSDHHRRWGRRGVIAVGVLFILIFLALFGLAGTIVLLALAYVGLQLAASSAQAGQQGFIPDLIPTRSRGTASGLKTFMHLLGSLIGFAALGALLVGGQIWPALLLIGAIVLITFLLTLGLVPEERRPIASTQRFSLIDAFRLDLSQHRPFFWLVISRFLFWLGTYLVGRFFLYFIAARLSLGAGHAAKQAGILLGILALVNLLGAPLGGWAADRFGRPLTMLTGVGLSVAGVLLLITASSSGTILLFGGIMALGAAAFDPATWALTADLAPEGQGARFYGLFNFGTAGAAAVAGLFGPLVDWVNHLTPGAGYSVLFAISALIFLASGVALRGTRETEKEAVARRRATPLISEASDGG